MPRITPHHPADSSTPPAPHSASVVQARLQAWAITGWRLGLQQLRAADAEAIDRLDLAIRNGVAHPTVLIDIQAGTASFVVNQAAGDPIRLFDLVPGPAAAESGAPNA